MQTDATKQTSYVREYFRSLGSVWECKYRRGADPGVLSFRPMPDDLELLQALAQHYDVSMSACVAMLVAEAVKDATEELGLWSPPEYDDDCEQVGGGLLVKPESEQAKK